MGRWLVLGPISFQEEIPLLSFLRKAQKWTVSPDEFSVFRPCDKLDTRVVFQGFNPGVSVGQDLTETRTWEWAEEPSLGNNSDG